MVRSEIVHKAAQAYVDTMTADELNKHVYESIRYNLRKLSDTELVDVINQYFPSVANIMNGVEDE